MMMSVRVSSSATGLAALLLATLTLSACTTVDLSVRDEPQRKPASASAPSTVPSSSSPPVASAPPSPAGVKKPGGYYQDDGPGDKIPDGLMDVPDAEPRIEPLARGPSKPYTVFEQSFVPITDNRPFVQRGKGSWYGKKFHGQRTASGEIYDMFKMTAAHPTLPIPSYARVTNLRNGRQVIVRINDRGPFHSSRIIDLSYTAALKLGYLQSGSAELEVERLLPEEILKMQSEKRGRDTLVQSPAQVLAPAPLGVDAIAQVAAQTSGFFLQFGAYAQEQNAQAMRERLMVGWPAELPAPLVTQSGGLYRLHSGPFSTRDQASTAAKLLKSVSQIQAAVVQR